MEEQKKFNKLRISVEETVVHNYDFEIPASITFNDSGIEEIRKAVIDEFIESKRLLGQPWHRISSQIELESEDDVESVNCEDESSNIKTDTHQCRFMGRLEEKE